MDRFQVHDLLRIASSAHLRGDSLKPDWVDPALKVAPWVVVRRIAAEGEFIPVGVRGSVRAQRWAAWVAENDVVEQLEPEALPARLAGLSPERHAATPALAAAAALDAAWRNGDAPPIWGPTGSVGFELASARPTASAASDLDVMIRCPDPVSVVEARAWLTAVSKAAAPLGARADVLLETPQGAVALLDYARAAPPVVLRTRTGPRLLHDPWFEAAVSI